ncbi:MAG: B12-binding domain-containing radical SAM protein [Acidobacteria bacterium]|nr:B12-binding domain-containing radical SAM protein [Acidobacteriota bacterium]MCI0624002.1 B12-binding domain-containing radical SAM protein [Acidobacteriota bacterium]MCI0720747.1 B12-binding domain-containing radical SAM protein [Acidobacteriota bacterium]
MNHKKVLLFYPPYSGKPLGPPLSLLSLAAPLEQAGYQVCCIDAAIEPAYLKRIASEIGDSICFGVSLLTGPMIRQAIESSQLVRRLQPQLPIIFGGWHPTLLPDQTLESGFADAIVRGQGELTFVEAVQRLEVGESLEGVAGVSYRHGEQIVHNPERPVVNINTLPLPAYHLVEVEAYAKACGVRKTVYASSVGCPYACNYCTDTIFYNRRFNALTAQRVVAEVTKLVERDRLEEVSFLDSNFPVDVKRAVAIARGFTETGVKFRWTFQASTDLLCRMSDEDVQLLGEAGVSHIGFGTESAAEEVLALMNKPHQKIADMFEAARKCHKAAIKATFNLIIGFPGETDAYRAETLRVMGEIARQFSNVSFSPNIFTPYPGIAVWDKLRELGMGEPHSLEEWANMPLGRNLLPWLQGADYQRVKRMLSYFVLNHQIRRAMLRTTLSPLRRRFSKALTAPLAWRLRHKFYGFPLELWMLQLKQCLALRRSLLTGESLGHDLEKIC